MLTRSRRLVHDRDFMTVFRHGTKARGRYVVVSYIENKLKFSRFGFVTSLKVAKQATERNRLKRQARVYISDNISNFRDNFDIVINFLPTARDIAPTLLRSEFDLLLQKLKK